MDESMIRHKELAESGRWAALSFAEQMANVGSEVFRAGKDRPLPAGCRPCAGALGFHGQCEDRGTKKPARAAPLARTSVRLLLWT